jgi:hypothetical protein
MLNRISSALPRLIAVDLSTLSLLLELATSTSATEVPAVVLASSMDLPQDRTSRLIEICAIQQITHLILGQDALASHDVRRLERAGLVLLRHVFVGDHERAPRPGITVLHHFFLFGALRVADWLGTEWNTVPVDRTEVA